MKLKPRFRYIVMGLGSAVILGVLLATDPDRAQGFEATKMLLLALAVPVLAVVFAHLARTKPGWRWIGWW